MNQLEIAILVLVLIGVVIFFGILILWACIIQKIQKDWEKGNEEIMKQKSWWD